jgi:hypothetical protein
MREAFGTLRIGVYWPQVEPAQGVHDLVALDDTVAAAAAAGIEVLPFVYGTPSWLSSDPMRAPIRSPAQRRAWTGFLRLLVDRYGPRGELWNAAAPRLPIRSWQVWNEPNFRLFWHPKPAPSAYAELLRVSAAAIRGEDPGARIVSAGLAPVGAGIMPQDFLARMYRVPGARAWFDVAALHPYATARLGVKKYVRWTRRVMALAGDGAKPLLISELGVASAAERPTGFNRGPRGQALFLRRTFDLLLRNRARWRIAGVDWFTWKDASSWDEHCSFCQYAGLVDALGRPKPAWWELKRVVASAVR